MIAYNESARYSGSDGSNTKGLLREFVSAIKFYGHHGSVSQNTPDDQIPF